MNTCNKAKKFLQDFFEISPNKCRDTVNEAQRKKVSMDLFEKRLQESNQSGQDWRDWKFSVQIKVTMVKKSEEKLAELNVEKSEDKTAEFDIEKSEDKQAKLDTQKYEGKPVKLVVKKSEEKTAKIDVEINLIQAAVIKWDIEQVKTITKLALKEEHQTVLDDILKEEMKYIVSDEWKNWDLSPKCAWISDATVIHLATCWHVESLIHFLDVRPHLFDHATSQTKYTPLHVASSCDHDTIAIKILIEKRAQIEAHNASKQTPLHLAAQFGLTKDVITLLFEGNANVMALDSKNHTPLHLAKTSEILDILLAKTDADSVNSLEPENCLFKHIVKNHPTSMQTYLDLMVTESNSDHYIFHLDMFEQNTTQKSRQLDKHLMLIDEKHPKMLRHPIMMFFTNLKWHPHKTWYYTNFTIFLVFLVSFTLHAAYRIDDLQCDCENVLPFKQCNETFGDLILNKTKCKEDLEPMLTITGFISWIFLGILTGIEILQFFAKLLNAILEKSASELWEYFSKQNMCEMFMLALGQAYFAFQRKEDMGSRLLGYGLQDDFLGWTLFLAWIDLTIFLGRFDICGKHIYRSWHVMKNVAFSMVVYIPVMVAFAAAFHCFLMNNTTFEGPVASFFKVLTMVLGEFDFEDNFIYDQVEEVKGSKWSVQIMLIMFIVYGSLIIMNLITAWIVITQNAADQTEVILAQQRIEEISGMPSFSIVFARCFQKCRKDEYSKLSKLCISQTQKGEEPNCFVRKWHQFKAYLADDNTAEVWSIKEHQLCQGEHCENKCENTPRVPSYTRALAQLTTDMMKAKKDKQNELIKIIKENQKHNENKLKELMSVEEQNSWLQAIPVGYELQSMVLKSPTGTLTKMILNGSPTRIQEEPLHE